MARPRTFDEAELIDKVSELFWKKGYSQTSIQDIVDHLGIKRASLYNAFKDKDELYLKALLHYQKVSLSVLKEIFSGEEDIKKGIEQLLRTAMAHPPKQSKKPLGCMMVNCTIEMSEQKDLYLFLRKNKAAFIKIATAYLKTGQKKGQLSSTFNVESAAHYLFTIYSGLQVGIKLKPTKSQTEKVIQLALKIFD